MTQKNTQDYRTELKVLVLRTGMKQAQLAERLGVGREYLSRVLNGHKAGYRLRTRLVREFGFPVWVLDGPPREKAA
jgi:transcriptional regulator with XRE-family HTH domain